MYDLIVIGAGPGGYEAAAHAGRKGKKVALIERAALGGTCLNAGCIPTKTLLRSAQVLTECRGAAAFGVRIPGQAQLDLAAVVARKNRIVGMLTKGVEGLLKRARVERIQGHAELVSADTVRAGESIYKARNILLATGSRPAVPPIPGIDSPVVLDSTAILDRTEIPASLAIVGGGYIGLEFASFFAAIGAKVTVLEMLPRIAAGLDEDIAARLRQSLAKAGIDIRTSSKVAAIDGQTVQYEDPGGWRTTLRADCILNAAGRVPVVDGLGLGRVGVDFDRQGIRTSDRGRTSVPGIWACGDVTGRRLLAHAATREGIVAVENMFGGDQRVRYEAIPSVIYTHPEVASAGRTEEELRAQGIEYRKATVPMAVAGRFLVEHDGAHGVVKVLTGAKYGEILGVHALGTPASEFIVLAAAMIEMEMRAADAAELVFPHPTVSEALKSAILETIGQE
ncbi:MAG: dihydrolipoyl dehydrogenase [Acidobacteria bacterium]|nr:dihydrolipoyl dehydrogenase [Acidobacteriota bacterium]